MRRRSRYARAPRKSGCGVSAEDIICRVLRLGGGMNQKLTIIAKFSEPAGHVCRLVVDYRG